jgi:hypothetical protein
MEKSEIAQKEKSPIISLLIIYRVTREKKSTNKTADYIMTLKDWINEYRLTREHTDKYFVIMIQ